MRRLEKCTYGRSHGERLLYLQESTVFSHLFYRLCLFFHTTKVNPHHINYILNQLFFYKNSHNNIYIRFYMYYTNRYQYFPHTHIHFFVSCPFLHLICIQLFFRLNLYQCNYYDKFHIFLTQREVYHKLSNVYIHELNIFVLFVVSSRLIPSSSLLSYLHCSSPFSLC